MTTSVISGKISQRELVQVAWKAGMLEATTAEITKYAILRYIGYSHEDAKTTALSLRKPVSEVADTEKNLTVQLPAHWITAAKEKFPGDNAAMLYRYILARLTMPEDQALAEASKTIGRPRKTQAA